MCWYLYGAVNGRVDETALDAVNRRHRCRLIRGTRHAVKMALAEGSADCRITLGFEMCDCGSDVGGHDPDAGQVRDMAAMIGEVSALPGAETVSLCMTWIGERRKRETVLKRSETDLARMLADLEPGTLYTVDCRK